MKTQEPHWQCYNALSRNKEGIPLLDWLLTSSSLTERLRHHSETFRVQVISHHWRQPFFSERVELNIKPREWASIREVLLICNGEPWVYARTVIPRNTLTGRHKKLLRLGTKPLGQFLFDDPTMKRSPFQLALISPCHYQYQQIMHHSKLVTGFTDKIPPQSFCWGRRSRFYLSGKPLLVSEIFTPFFPFYPTNKSSK